MMKLVIVLLATGSSAMTATATQGLFCREPSEPYCISAYGTFDDEFAFERCRNEVERYLDDVDRYAQCRIDEVQREIRTKRQEADDIVERFNCKAQGNDFCY